MAEGHLVAARPKGERSPTAPKARTGWDVGCVDGAGFYRNRWPVRDVALIGNVSGALGSVKQRRDMIRPAS